jgi:hydrogenase-4 membrane subunit HyfE
MSPLLVALLAVLLIPLFVATWRASLLGLGCQGVVMALVAYRLQPDDPSTSGAWLTLIDLGLVRGFIAPLALYTVLKARQAPARHDLIPPNLLSWALALSMVLLSFTFAELLVAEAGDQRTLVAVASTGVLLGFLVLSTQSSPFSQMIGALRIENAIVLMELGGKRHEAPLGVQLALLGAFVATIAFFRWYLTILSPSGLADTTEDSGGEGPTL